MAPFPSELDPHVPRLSARPQVVSIQNTYYTLPARNVNNHQSQLQAIGRGQVFSPATSNIAKK